MPDFGAIRVNETGAPRLRGAGSFAPAARIDCGGVPGVGECGGAPALSPAREAPTVLSPPPPGLARGTLIATRRGPVPIEALRPGDKVQTLDDGLRPLTWLAHWRAPAEGVRAPVRIAPGPLGNDRALVLAPGHRLLLRPAAGPLAGQEILIAAAALTGWEGITRRPQPLVEWFAPVFALHAVIFAENARIESLLPLPQALGALPPADRATLEARAAQTPAAALPARPIVPEARARRLILRHGSCLDPPAPCD